MTRGATKDVEMAPPPLKPLSTGLIGAHAALMVHTNEIRARGQLPAFDQYMFESGFGWLDSMLDHAKEQVKQHAASHEERAKYGAKQRKQDTLAMRGEILKTPSRKKAAASRFPGGERAASKAWRAQQRDEAVEEQRADKENTPAPVAVAPSTRAASAAPAPPTPVAPAPVKAGNTSISTATTRATRSKADKVDAAKVAVHETRGTKNSLADTASSDSKSSKASKKAKTAASSSSSGAASSSKHPLSSSSDAPQAASSSSSSRRDAAQVSARVAPSAVLVAVEVSDAEGSMDVDYDEAPVNAAADEHPRASTPPKAAAVKTRAGVTAKLAKAKLDESLLPIEEAHSSDISEEEGDEMEEQEEEEPLVSAKQSLEIPVEVEPEAAAPVAAAPALKRTLGGNKSMGAAAVPAAAAQASTTSAAPGFGSSFLNKSLRGKAPAVTESVEHMAVDESPTSPSIKAVESTLANTLANAQSSSNSSSATTSTQKKRKSDEVDSQEEAPFSDALSQDPVEEAATSKARKLDAAPRTAPEVARTLSGGTGASSSSAVTAGAASQRSGNLENIMSRLEKVRRTSGAQRGNPAAALMPPTSTVGLGAGLASSILGGRSNAQVAATAAVSPAPIASSANWEQLDDSSAEVAVAEAKETQRDRVASSDTDMVDLNLNAASAPPSPGKGKGRQLEASTTPVHSPAPSRAETAVATATATPNDCAIASDSEDDEPPAPIRAVPQRRDDTAMTLDELARNNPAPVVAPAAAAAAPAPAPAPAAKPKAAASASQGLGRMMQPVKPIADMPKVSVNLTGNKSGKSAHRPPPKQQAAPQATAGGGVEDHVAASASQTTSNAAAAAELHSSRGGWGIIGHMKAFLGTGPSANAERVITPSGSGFMPSRPGTSNANAASASQAAQGRAPAPLVVSSSASAAARKNSITGPSGNIGGALAASQSSQNGNGNGKPASLARAELARRKEMEEADRKKREKDDRRTQMLAAREAKAGKSTTDGAKAGKRAREEERNAQVAYVSVPSVAKPKVPASAIARTKELGISPDGKRRRVSDEREAPRAVPSASSKAAAQPRPQQAVASSSRPAGAASNVNSGIPRGNNFGASQSSQHPQAMRVPVQSQQAGKPAAPSGNVFQQGAASRPAQVQQLPRQAAPSAAHQTPKAAPRAATPEEFVEFVEPASDYSQSGDEETEERRGKEQPWEREELLAALERQRHIDPDAIFGIPHGAVPVQEWLDTLPSRTAEQRAQTTERLRRPRTSSGTWSRDGLVQAEIDRYNEAMGIVGAGVRLPPQASDAAGGSASQAAANAKNHRQSFLARGPSALALDAANQARNAASQRPGPSGSNR